MAASDSNSHFLPCRPAYLAGRLTRNRLRLRQNFLASEERPIWFRPKEVLPSHCFLGNKKRGTLTGLQMAHPCSSGLLLIANRVRPSPQLSISSTCEPTKCRSCRVQKDCTQLTGRPTVATSRRCRPLVPA